MAILDYDVREILITWYHKLAAIFEEIKMAEENFADQCATGTEDFSSGFIQNTAQMEQQPLQQPIEQQAGGDGQNQTAQSIISMARPEDDGRKIFVGGLSWDTTTSKL